MFVVLVLASLWSTAAPQPVSAPNPERLSASVHRSIEHTLMQHDRRAGAALAAQVARLLRWRGDVVRDVHPGDGITLLYERGEIPELVALDYRGASIRLQAFRMTDAEGIARFYDAEGQLIEPQMLNPPVPEYVQITETVQSGRGKRRHRGLDLKAPEGTPVRLPFAGVVSRVNWSTRTNGNCVEILYSSGPLSGKRARFLHLANVADSVRPGARLQPGVVLGGVGSTGRSSAPHLHYEVRDAKHRALSPLQVHGTKVGYWPDTEPFAIERLARLLAAEPET